MRQSLIRKKSSLRSLRPSAAPASPVKTVHFNDNLEEMQHFLQNDKPSSISKHMIQSKEPSVRWEITATNLSNATDNYQSLVQLESLHVAIDCQSLVGAVTVANIAFEKHVVARFTIDDWQTISEATADFRHTQKPTNTHDQFQFVIKLPDQADACTKTLLLCIRYRVNGQEYWDNNSGNDYQVIFTRKTPQRGVPSGHFSDRYNFTASLRETITQDRRCTVCPPQYGQAPLRGAGD
jgi:hypothetical protein